MTTAPRTVSQRGMTFRFQHRMIIDPGTTRLLAYEDVLLDASGKATRINSVAYQAMGWTNKMDERP